jgi:hypothetical protein
VDVRFRAGSQFPFMAHFAGIPGELGVALRWLLTMILPQAAK